jgi:CBS domain-containing protein
MYVYERMTTEVASIQFDEKVSAAFAKMQESRHSRLPVTDEKGRVMGLISRDSIADILNIASAQVP